MNKEYPEKKFFGPWDIDKIIIDYKKWKRTSWSYIYFLANQKEIRSVHAYIGNTQNVRRRMRQINGQLFGGPSQTKKAAGSWTPILYIRIPPYRNFNMTLLKQMFKKGKGWKNKCINALTIAHQYGFDICISKDLCTVGAVYYKTKIYNLLKKIKHDKCTSMFKGIFLFLLCQLSWAGFITVI